MNLFELKYWTPWTWNTLLVHWTLGNLPLHPINNTFQWQWENNPYICKTKLQLATHKNNRFDLQNSNYNPTTREELTKFSVTLSLFLPLFANICQKHHHDSFNFSTSQPRNQWWLLTFLPLSIAHGYPPSWGRAKSLSGEFQFTWGHNFARRLWRPCHVIMNHAKWFLLLLLSGWWRSEDTFSPKRHKHRGRTSWV